MSAPEPRPRERSLILLDGALGTQLRARGFALEAPLFSARALLDAPELLGQLHLDYVLAGAQVLSTNSFGLHAATLALAGLAGRQSELAARALELLHHTRRCAADHKAGLARFRIAASISPRPPLRLPPARVRAEYRALAEALLDSGADLILLETFTEISEIRLALEAMEGLSAPLWLGVVAGAQDPASSALNGSRLASGQSFAELHPLLRPEPGRRHPDALLINCTQIDAVPRAIESAQATIALRPARALQRSFGVYPHLGRRGPDGSWQERILSPAQFAATLHGWSERWPELELLGACCGGAPADICALRELVHPDDRTSERSYARLAELLP